MTSVKLDSRQLKAARLAVAALAEQIDSQRATAYRNTPVTLPDLADGASLARSAAWLRDQTAGLQTLEDLALLLETKGGTATYTGNGSFAGAQKLIGTEIGKVLESLDPDDPGDLAGLARLADLLQRYRQAPGVTDELIKEVGATGLVHAFDKLVPPGPPPGSSPEDVHAWWIALTPAQQLAATLVQSKTYGNTDGVPAWSRDMANRKNLPEYRSELQGLLAKAEADGDFELGDLDFPGGLLFDKSQVGLLKDKLAALDEVQSVLGRGDRQLLLLDPFDGDQLHAAVAVGDVDTADNVSVFTPGFTSNVQDSLSGYDSSMASLNRVAGDESTKYGDGGTVATVTWMGYDAPQWSGLTDAGTVASPALADRGAPDLASFYEGIPASRGDDPHLTALGHSYGSLTTGKALQQVDDGVVDDAVVFGSPGLGTWDRGDINVPDGHLYRVEAHDDPVADLGGTAPFGVDPSHMSGVSGLSAKDADIGGEQFDSSSGHSAYLHEKTTSQHNIAVTVAGVPERMVHDDSVPLWDGRHPTGDLYSEIPVLAHSGYEQTKDVVETGGELASEGVDKAKDFVDHIHLPTMPDPVLPRLHW